MGFESAPKPKSESENNGGGTAEIAQRWIRTVDKNGLPLSIGVYEGETDKDAMARAKAIDARLHEEGKSESSFK